MSTFKQVVNAPSAITVTGLSTLASATYATSNAINNSGQPLDLFVELAVTPGTVSGNKQAVIFALGSLDGTNYQTGANATDESDMTLIGVLPLNSNATAQRRAFSVAQAFGGILPPYIKFVVKNDSGAAFTAGSLAVSEVYGSAV